MKHTLILFGTFILIAFMQTNCGQKETQNDKIESQDDKATAIDLSSKCGPNSILISAKKSQGEGEQSSDHDLFSNQSEDMYQDSDIINGELAYYINTTDNPAPLSTVAVIFSNGKNESICSGVMIEESLLITAAHCFLNGIPKKVIFGNSIYSPRDIIPVARACSHSDFDYKKVKNANPLFDIAWVELPSKAPRYIQPVKILQKPSQVNQESRTIIAGYGATSETENFTYGIGYLRTAESKIGNVSQEKIKKFNETYGDNSFANFMVVLSQTVPPRAACRGDSGGPAYILKDNIWVLVAITQGAHNLLTPKLNNPAIPATCESGEAIYTSVGNYIPWIQETSGKKLDLL
ncbi:MAG: trypsin-like serine protease [Silvanigrellaceae bacterium]|nr:trypsin-like serine protease [Silvanigrellaceae bacterium]